MRAEPLPIIKVVFGKSSNSPFATRAQKHPQLVLPLGLMAYALCLVLDGLCLMACAICLVAYALCLVACVVWLTAYALCLMACALCLMSYALCRMACVSFLV